MGMIKGIISLKVLGCVWGRPLLTEYATISTEAQFTTSERVSQLLGKFVLSTECGQIKLFICENELKTKIHHTFVRKQQK